MATLSKTQMLLVLTLFAGFLLPGCSSDGKEKSKTRQKEGVAKLIDLENNIVSMVCKDEKGREHELRGTVTEDTEVWINGRIHKLEDIREGDRVTVVGYQEGHGTEKKLVAVKVIVDRPRDSDWKSTGKPVDEKSDEPATSAKGNPKKEDLTTGEKTPQ